MPIIPLCYFVIQFLIFIYLKHFENIYDLIVILLNIVVHEWTGSKSPLISLCLPMTSASCCEASLSSFFLKKKCNVYIYRVCFAKNYTVFRIWGTQFSTIHVVLCPDNYTDSFLSCWAWLNGQGNSFAHLFPWKVFLGDTIFIIIGGSDLLASQQNLLSFSKNQMKISRVVCSMIQSLNLPKMYFGEF